MRTLVKLVVAMIAGVVVLSLVGVVGFFGLIAAGVVTGVVFGLVGAVVGIAMAVLKVALLIVLPALCVIWLAKRLFRRDHSMHV